MGVKGGAEAVKWDKKLGGGGTYRGYSEAFGVRGREVFGGAVGGELDDFAAICLQRSGSVLCGRTGGRWPPYFC